MTDKSPIVAAAQAHTELCIFGTIVSVLEGSNIWSSSGHRAAARMIKICHREQQLLLMEYDRQVRKGQAPGAEVAA